MRQCTTQPVQRTWMVELRPDRSGPVLVCSTCPPPGIAPVRAAAHSAVAHLAQHAHRDALPAHLRTCQCHARGCRWHPRHRGCAGGILLVLVREHGGRRWRLADTCAACAGATEHAAVVPDTALQTLPSAFPPRRRRGPGDLAEEVRVREMLSYLAAALPRQPPHLPACLRCSAPCARPAAATYISPPVCCTACDSAPMPLRVKHWSRQGGSASRVCCRAAHDRGSPRDYWIRPCTHRLLEGAAGPAQLTGRCASAQHVSSARSTWALGCSRWYSARI